MIRSIKTLLLIQLILSALTVIFIFFFSRIIVFAYFIITAYFYLKAGKNEVQITNYVRINFPDIYYRRKSVNRHDVNGNKVVNFHELSSDEIARFTDPDIKAAIKDYKTYDIVVKISWAITVLIVVFSQ
jgi:hypothetical protein